MPTEEDAALVWKLLQSTEAGTIDWQSTALQEQYAATFGGKWTVTIDKAADEGQEFFWLSINNLDGKEMLRIYSAQDSRLSDLFEKARRHALKVTEAIKDIFSELDSH